MQQNITELRQYESSVSDLFRSSNTCREERALLLRDVPENAADAADAGPQVAELMRLVPPETGFYRAFAAPTVEDSLALLEQKVLTPRLGPTPVSKIAPTVPSGVQPAGNQSNLDVRIDTPPSSNGEEANGDGALKEILKKAKVRAALQLHGSEADGDGVFVRLHSTIVLPRRIGVGGTVAQQAIQEYVIARTDGLHVSGSMEESRNRRTELLRVGRTCRDRHCGERKVSVREQ